MKCLVGAIVLGLACASVAEAQCPYCQPRHHPQPQAAQPQQGVPGILWVRQRRGLFGWRKTWTPVPTTFVPVQLVPVQRVPVQRVPTAYIW